MARKKYHKPKGPFYRLNHNIRAQEVRVVDERGKQVGVMPVQDALKLAVEKKLDLVEVAPLAKPPVCKVINFKKFKFNEAKKKQKEKKKTKKVEVKQLRLTPFIAENDLKFRLERGEEFLTDGNRVKISVFFRGREMAKKDFGYRLLEKAIEKLKPISKIESEPKFVGRRLETLLSPSNAPKENNNRQQKRKAVKKEPKDKKGEGNGQAKTKNQKVSQKKGKSN